MSEKSGKCPFSVFTSKKNRIEEDKPSVIEDYEDDLFLRVRRLNATDSATLYPANARLKGPNGQCETTDWPRKDAVSKCGPYVHANQMGWWLFPANDLDVTYRGDNNWEIYEYKKFDDKDEEDLSSSLPPYIYEDENGEKKMMRHGARGKVNAGMADHHIIQIWTGLIFRTPPGWVLLIRSPINAEEGYNRPYHIQEGIIESDWMDYDIWTNVTFDRTNERVEIRRDMWPPLAQIIPIRREAYEANWEVDNKVMDKDDPEWASWQDYNFKKWKREDEKQSKTYFRERAIQKPIPESAGIPKILKVRDKYRKERDTMQKYNPKKEDNNETS